MSVVALLASLRLARRRRADIRLSRRLRQVDVKAEHFERQVARIEQERDQWEKRCEEAQEKYNKSKQELDEVRLDSFVLLLATLATLPFARLCADGSESRVQLARAMEDI